VEESIKADQIIPVLVLSEWELSGSPADLAKTLQYYVDSDDVCGPDFTSILVMKPSDSGSNKSTTSFETSFTFVYHLRANLAATGNTRELPSGPYFLSGQNLHQAWRLFPDDLDAFTVGMIPENVEEPKRYIMYQQSGIATLISKSQFPRRDIPIFRRCLERRSGT
jgi:hypothetical protein